MKIDRELDSYLQISIKRGSKFSVGIDNMSNILKIANLCFYMIL